jgi:hypothetical protein
MNKAISTIQQLVFNLLLQALSQPSIISLIYFLLEKVKEIQRFLTEAGYRTKVDGIFG